MIYAAHGGEDGGAVGKNGILEKDVNLSVAKILYDILYINNFPVSMTRTEDVMLYGRYENTDGKKKIYDLKARLDIANETENPLFISIHMNSYPGEECRGAQVYYSKNNDESVNIAGKIQNYVSSYIQPENKRKIKSATSSIFLLDRIKCPAVLIECGFLSNYEECEKLSSDDYRKALTVSLFGAIADYMSNEEGT